VNADNEHILKAQEESNGVLLNKLHDHENLKNKEFVSKKAWKRKVRNKASSYTDIEPTNEKLNNKRKQKYEDSNESSDSN